APAAFESDRKHLAAVYLQRPRYATLWYTVRAVGEPRRCRGIAEDGGAARARARVSMARAHAARARARVSAARASAPGREGASRERGFTPGGRGPLPPGREAALSRRA